MTDQPVAPGEIEETPEDDYVDVHAPRPARPRRGPHKGPTQVAAEVWAGWWGKGDSRKDRLDAAGFDGAFIMELVDKGVGKTTAERFTDEDYQNFTSTEVVDEV